METFNARVEENAGKWKKQGRQVMGVVAHDWGPPALPNGFFLSTSSLTLVCVLFDGSRSDRGRFLGVLICFSVTIGKVEHLVICLWTSHVTSLEK